LRYNARSPTQTAAAMTIESEVALATPLRYDDGNGDMQGSLQAEFDRAAQAHLPLLCLRIAVDRLDRLEAQYGQERTARIFPSLAQLVAEVAHAPGVFACRRGDGLVALVPDRPPEVGGSVAEALLRGAARLRPEGFDQPLRVSLSVGWAHNQRRGLRWDTMLRVAEEGLSVARAGGGGRLVHTELYQLFQPDCQPFAPDPGQRGGRAKLPGESPLAKPAPKPETAPAPKADLGVLVAEIRSDLERVYAEKLQGREQEVDLLNRRIRKLSEALGATEQELLRVAQMKSIDEGVASLYRTVQGLAESEANFAIKKQLMTDIFEANVRLRLESACSASQVSLDS
jgi:GGDEF domain-containing protein